jgi:hypothetical protein
MPLEPPPEAVFGSKAELDRFARSWAADHGYALVVKGSDENRIRL